METANKRDTRASTLSSAHNELLMSIENEQERSFYETEAINQRWDFDHLQRQYDNSLYERYAISCDKDALMKTAEKG